MPLPTKTPPPKTFPFTDLPAKHCTDLVYFSSTSENTKRFVERLGRPVTRIPLHPRTEGMIRVHKPYILIVPTYGSGRVSKAVPPQVIAFLNDPVNRSLIRGVISSGNTNFGTEFCLAGEVISRKCKVPQLYTFELLGTEDDVRTVANGLNEFWANIQGESR